jgi:hypothetical protein
MQEANEAFMRCLQLNPSEPQLLETHLKLAKGYQELANRSEQLFHVRLAIRIFETSGKFFLANIRLNR